MKNLIFLFSLILFQSCQETTTTSKPSSTEESNNSTTTSANCLVPNIQTLVQHQTTQIITTYDNSDLNQTCDSRKSTAIASCVNGNLSVSGTIYDDLNCTGQSTITNLSCRHSLVGTVPSGQTVNYVTYSQSTVTTPAVCSGVKKELKVSCLNGVISTLGEVGTFPNCLEADPVNLNCFDSTSQRSIAHGSSVQVISYNGPEYFAPGLCEQNKHTYTASCSNGVVTRTGIIGSFLTCQELPNPNIRTGKAYFTFNPSGPPLVNCRGLFEIPINNFSDKPMIIDMASFKALGPTTGINYATQLQVIDSGCSGVISPNSGCSFTIKNNIQLQPNHMATPIVSVLVRYGNEENKVAIDEVRTQRNGRVITYTYATPYVTFLGCH